ncbi:hypothetical protein [Streptomyces sp. CBMA156]|uniref:hypothetical protein n=1 Tax=Streptomyces sp. CBMA156 TaxID=1930280 RepID=UPI001661D4A1|nr:hypothetical protein [Streptomyces sp. CBMA156]
MTHHPPTTFHSQRPTARRPSAAHSPPNDDRSPEQLVAAGVLRRHPDPRPHPALGHSPIDYVTAALWAELTALAIAPAAAEATATALLRAIADQAVDAALAPGNERAPHDDLYVADPAHIGPHRRAVWFQRSGPRGPLDPLTPLDPRGGYGARRPITAAFAPHEP